MRDGKEQSQPEIGAATLLVLYMVLGPLQYPALMVTELEHARTVAQRARCRAGELNLLSIQAMAGMTVMATEFCVLQEGRFVC